MMKSYRYLLFTLFLLLSSSLMLAQKNTLSGTVSDATTGEKLIGANVLITDLNTGAATNMDGYYFIDNVTPGVYEVTVTYIGYLKLNKNVKISGSTKLNLSLEPSSVIMQETVVKSTKAVLRETPVAFSEVKGEDLEFKLASRDIPEELATTPSIYSSVQGGGLGDATLYVRGYNQRNVSVMVNGVPVNDMESNAVYWSNWAGLGDVLETAQAQRGIGNSPYSYNAVGGLVNMTTRGMGDNEEFVKYRSEYGTGNKIKNSIAFTKKLSNNITATALVSRRTWDGYAVGTFYKEYTYFFSIGGVFGNHSLQFTGIGSPQIHGQRPSSYAQLTYSDWQKYGKTFNYAVGRLRGDWYSEVINYYFKPAFNLDWNWQLSSKTVLSTVFYYSTGTGGGSGTAGSYAPAITSGEYLYYRDYDKVWANNSSYLNYQYSTTLHRSTTVLVNSVNNHKWGGVLSTLKTQLSPEVTLNVGLDGRYYMGDHYKEIRDLLGGDYYVDATDIGSGIRLCKKGDKVSYYDDFYVRQLGSFGQIEYKSGDLSTFLNLSVSHKGAQRVEFFIYKNDSTSAWQNFVGYTLKTGINYNFDTYNSAYFNLGYYSSAPLVSSIFANYSNAVSRDSKNEKVLILELGYGLSTSFANVKLNAFSSAWMDRAIPNNSVTGTDGTIQYVNIYGAKQLHMGVELESTLKLLRGLELRVNGSLINAKYQNNVSAIISPEDNPSATKTVNLYTKGLYVSEFPMEQLIVQLNYRFNILSGLNMYVNPEYRFTGKYYSYFDPDTRTTPTYDANKNLIDGPQSWKIPDANIVNFHLGLTYYLTDFFLKRINLNFHVFNMFNNPNYIVYGKDGSDHTIKTSKFFYGQDRWYNVGVAFTF